MMKIRAAILADAPKIAALVHCLGDIQAVAGQSVETTTASIRANLLRVASDNALVLVAESPDGEIAGYCCVHWVPFLFFAGGEAYVTELFVRPEDSGVGIGSKLLDEAVSEARRRGCARVSLLNGRDGESYRRKFYAKRGWTERERMANFVLPLNLHDRNDSTSDR